MTQTGTAEKDIDRAVRPASTGTQSWHLAAADRSGIRQCYLPATGMRPP